MSIEIFAIKTALLTLGLWPLIWLFLKDHNPLEGDGLAALVISLFIAAGMAL